MLRLSRFSPHFEFIGDESTHYGLFNGCGQEKAMKCIVCKQEDTQPGTTTLSIDKGETIVVIRNVPAEICALCGEEYIALIL